MSSILRPYQKQAKGAAWQAITPEVNRVAIEMATGLGKTVTFADLIGDWLSQETDGQRHESGCCALVLVHTDELTRQAVDKIRTVTRGRWTIGVVKASRNEVDADIIVASVQTLARPERRAQIKDVGLIIVDEAHHAVAKSYTDILEHYGALPDDEHIRTLNEAFGIEQRKLIPTFGFTATMARSDGKGLGLVWQDLAFSRSLPWAIRKGWLIDLVPYTIKIPGIDAGSSDAALDAQLSESIAPEAVVQAWIEKVGEPHIRLHRWAFPSTVLFAPLVRSAQAFADAFNDAGVKAEVVHGALPTAEREAILARYEAGVTTVLCNAMVLTEGWDSPRTMCVIVARPTQSVPLFVQMVGRGMRPWLDASAPAREEQRCILLCVAGTSTDLATIADLSDKIGEGQDGKSLLAMEDEFDIGQDLEPDEDNAYRGPVRVEQWDALVQRSSKAWKYTAAGIPFLPTAKRAHGYVFVVETARGWEIWTREKLPLGGYTSPYRVSGIGIAPDLELAMALAEDEAVERGGDIGALLADKTRPWRKAKPSMEMLSTARMMGVPEEKIQAILTSKAGGKAGKLSDLIDTVTATRVLDGNAAKIRERGKA